MSWVTKNPQKILQHASHLTSSLYLQIYYCICAHALHGVEFQIPLEVSGIEPRNRQTVAKTGLDGGGRTAEFNSQDVMLYITNLWAMEGLQWSPESMLIWFVCVCVCVCVRVRVRVCVYQWDSSWLQAWCRGSGVHVVKQAVYLPQRNSSSSVTDLTGGKHKDSEF